MVYVYAYIEILLNHSRCKPPFFVFYKPTFRLGMKLSQISILEVYLQFLQSKSNGAGFEISDIIIKLLVQLNENEAIH